MTVGPLEMRARASQAARVDEAGGCAWSACSGDDIEHPVKLAGHRVHQLPLVGGWQHIPGVGLDLEQLTEVALAQQVQRASELALGRVEAGVALDEDRRVEMDPPLRD